MIAVCHVFLIDSAHNAWQKNWPPPLTVDRPLSIILPTFYCSVV